MIFYTADGSKVACRPSGTEPKIKYYFSVNAPISDAADYPTIQKQLMDKIALLKEDFK